MGVKRFVGRDDPCQRREFLHNFDHSYRLRYGQGREGSSLPLMDRCAKVTYRVIVILRSTAIRSERGGCVLKSPENTCPALRGATMNSDAVVGETFMGILAL